MKVRFGYVAMAVTLKDASPSKTVTYANLQKIPREYWHSKLTKLARLNLENTSRILRFNFNEGIFVYRFTSKLVPLATHPELSDWDWFRPLRRDFLSVGQLIREAEMRVSAHPDHFTVLNSPAKDVTLAAVRDLKFHHDILTAMGLNSQAKLVLHVGGAYDGKEQAKKRFLARAEVLPKPIRDRITLENDDHNYSIGDVLELGEDLGMPVVLDLHHHRCCNQGEALEEFWPRIVETWAGTGLPPKIHLSSPKDGKNSRSHADFVRVKDFLPFLSMAAGAGVDFDVMIEAKRKSAALARLVAELEKEPRLIKGHGAEFVLECF